MPLSSERKRHHSKSSKVKGGVALGIINVLDKHTANLIAAGEVVERPASAVKEMLENCADAGAKSVTVEIKDGGTSFIRITDDGCGISRDDVPKTILRHATSKIKTGSDLEAIGTLGFRGEALAAIAAVSEVRILTKRAEDEDGTLFMCSFGEIVCTEDTGCPDGTTIIVENIFENTPARRKFLKKNSTEATAVFAVCEKFALSKPDISVKLISDGATKLQTPGDGKLKNVIYSAIGREFANNMLAFEYELSGVRVYGYIGKPETCRPNRNMQNFFVNGRYIKSRTMMAALEEGFRGFCPVSKFPACVMFLEIGLNLVDVNIHPAKLEIKFSDERKIFDCIYFAVKNALSKGMSEEFFFGGIREKVSESYLKDSPASDNGDKKAEAPAAPVVPTVSEISKEAEMKKETPVEAEVVHTKHPTTEQTVQVVVEKKSDVPHSYIPDIVDTSPAAKKNEAHTSQTATEAKIVNPFDEPESVTVTEPKKEPDALDNLKITDINEPLFTEPERKPVEKQTVYKQEEILKTKELIKPVFIGEVFNTYLIIERDDKMYIIDKHAAHERIIYERIKHSSDNNEAQYMLVPIAVTLTPKEFSSVKDNVEYFTKIGFDFDEFGDDSFLIRSIPAIIDLTDAKDIFTFLAGKLADGNTRSAGEIFDRALYSAACKAAIKAGIKFTTEDNKFIINEIFENDAVLYCPHGRPVITEFTKERIEKMFGRL